MNNYLMKIREDLMKNRILLSDYRFSVGSAALLAVISAVFEILEYDFDLILPFDEAFPTRFLLFFCLLALFTETCFQRKPEWKRWGLLLSAVLAAADAFLIGLGEPDLLFGISGSLLRMRAREISEGALWLLPVLVVYLCHRRTEQPFERYLLKLSVRILEMLSVYLVLIIGTALVSAVFDRLLLGNNSSAVTVIPQIQDHLLTAPPNGQADAYMRAFYKITVDPDTVLYINDFELTYKKGMKDGADYLECGIPGEVGAVLLRR